MQPANRFRRGITFTQLEYVVALAEYKHFGAAARACSVSQPTLSMQLRKLEDSLQIEIFDRRRKPLAPTPLGAVVIEQAMLVLHGMRRIEDLVEDGRNSTSGEMRLAVIPTIAPYLLPLFLPAFAMRYPQLTLSIEEMKTENILQGLRKFTIDAAILATPLGDPGLTETPLFYEHFLLYSSPSHPLNRKRRVRESDLNAGEMWLLSEGHCLRTQILKLCREKQVQERHVRFECGSIESLLGMIDAGGGYTLIPYLAAVNLSSSRKSKVRKLDGRAPLREVSLVYNSLHARPKIFQTMQDIIQKSLPAELKNMRKEKGTVLLPLSSGNN